MPRTPAVLVASDNPSHTKRPSRRRVIEVTWVLGVVAFTLVRLVVAKETLGRYGLNLWVFGFIDLVTAVPYAIGVARVVGALVDRNTRSAGWWVLVAAASFLAPYAYVMLAGRGASFPVEVYVILGLVMTVFALNAIWSTTRKVRLGRTPTPVPPPEGDGGEGPWLRAHQEAV